jgi:hypothetical protein
MLVNLSSGDAQKGIFVVKMNQGKKDYETMYKIAGILCLIFFWISCSAEKIDRKSVVCRHNVEIKDIDTLNSLSLGNGRFAMTMDITGLQTFPIYYSKGVPLGTLSEWGWHSFPDSNHYTIEETLQSLVFHGRKVPYARQWPANTPAGKAADYLRQNPHRIHLGTLGLYIKKSDGKNISISDIKNIDQTLNLWDGELISRFDVEGIPVEVISLIGQDDNDILGVKIISKLIGEGRLGLNIKYPYPTGRFLDEASTYDPNEPERLKFKATGSKHFSIIRTLDSIRYSTNFSSSLNIISVLPTSIGFCIKPDRLQDSWTFLFAFSKTKSTIPDQGFEEFRHNVHAAFHAFWNSGGMIDFGKVKDARAKELERRMVLSLYLTKINCGGNSPPQETGLTYNSWYGKSHMEMEWWHGVHFALWNRPDILEKQMDWYLRNMGTAEKIAKRQGFKGVRWQKMTDNEGQETASSIGSYLIWQQPHIIYFAELLYRIKRNREILDKYKETVEQTAEFMADFAWYDTVSKKYILGPGVIPAQECFDPETTFNPTFELAYWRWGLETAQTWLERLGLERNKKWDIVLKDLSPLPQKDSLYLATESAPDSYLTKRYMRDHPSVLCTYGMLPATAGLDKKVMRNTFEKIWKNWQWKDTWGWDFPMAAMTATRLGYPEQAIEALLMPVETNTYLKNGHNFQNNTLRIYLPGNGGLLAALAMMADGTDETTKSAPGFPEDWDVKYEGFNRMP